MSPVQILATSSMHGSEWFAAVLGAAKTKASGSPIFIILLVGLGVFYFVVMRPRSQKARRAQQANRDIDVGDKVMLSSGIIGHVQSFEDDHAFVEIAPGTVIEVLRRAVVQRVDPVPESADDLVGDDEDADPTAGHGSADDPYRVPPLEGTEHDDTDDEGSGGGTK